MTPVAVHHVSDGPLDAAVVVLSNSLGTNLAMWERQVGVLAERFRVVRYDQRGHGASPVPPGPYRIEDLGADVLALLDRLGIQRAHFCGLSLGGMTGMWLATNAPERIDRLVLLCTAPLLESRPWLERAATIRSQGTAAVAPAVVQRWFTPAFAERDPAMVARMQATIADTPDEGYAACCEAIASLDLSASLADIGAETLVIAAAADPAIPPEHAWTIAAGIPAARVEIVVDAAHLANIEQPEAVTGLILSHLTSPSPNR